MRRPFKTKMFIAVCTLPAFLLAAYFIIWPAVQVLYQSFTNSTVLGLREPEFVGMKNFVNMFGDKNFMTAFWNTAKLVLAAPFFTVVFALILAFMVTQSKLKERGLYRTVFFFPSIVSITVIGIVWSFIFHPTRGVLNKLLALVGQTSFEEQGFAWLVDPNTAIWAIAVAFIWQSAGYFMVMHIAAIDGVADEIFEAATIDGAGQVRKLLSITLPLIKDIVGITFIFSLSGILDSSFTLSRVMTPRGQAEVLLSYSYTQGFTNAQYGYAMAITAFTLIIAIGLAALSRFVTSRQEG
ncbi:MAG: sugar ABC transporter permease [Oscillospiraceae bacterium]|nr:sugar ABC transporter permease [Oscillospiraceae bacterium]